MLAEEPFSNVKEKKQREGGRQRGRKEGEMEGKKEGSSSKLSW